jgi:succinate dehydrogenase / fumarate reductase cytochrome b subunit
MTDAPRTTRQPPLSPHLQVWRFHLTMATSILHRITGVGLYVGALIAAAWAIALAQGPEPYALFKSLLGSIPGKVVMLGLTVCFFFHLAHGLRHIVWDSGHGFEIKSATFMSFVALAFTLAATIAIWVIAAMIGAL